jgi:hypothetical protein
VFHYLFPQLTMGLALLIVVHEGDRRSRPATPWNDAARFWIRIFGVNFAVGVVTGIPMEFQFGTNWANFSRYAGGVIGQTLAMEGLFAFFLESSFLGLLSSASGASARAGTSSPPGAVRRQLAVRLLHHRHQRVHAAPGRPRRRAPTARCSSTTSGPSCSTRGRSRSTRTTWSPAVVTASFVVAAVGAYYALEASTRQAARFLASASSPGSCRACWSRSRPATSRRSWSPHQPVRWRRWRATSRARPGGIV